MSNKLILLVLTYNRFNKLKLLMNSLAIQSRHDFELLVIDNYSNDATQNFFSNPNNYSFPFKIHYYRTEENRGASNGYSFGFRKAQELGFDWLYVGDDDAYYEKDVIQNFYLSISKFKTLKVLCGSVYDMNNKLQLPHRRNYKLSIKGLVENFVPEDKYKLESIDIKLFSFVGLFLNSKVISSVGLPNEKYYIWWDDTEYSIRVSKEYKIKLVPKIKFIHDSEIQNGISWKQYYGFRNRLYTIRKFFPWWVTFVEEIKHIFKIVIFLVLFKFDKFQLYYFSFIDYKRSKLGFSLRNFK